jgi:ABC-2 type transport system permease protein
MIIGFAISTEIRDVKVAIFDPHPTVEHRQIIDQLDASPYFSVTAYLQAPSEIEEIFRRGKTGLVVVFDADTHHQTQVQLIADGADPNQSATVTMYAQTIISQASAQAPEIRMLYNPEMKGSYNFVPGLMGLVFMLICAMMTSIAIVREKETGTMEVLLASPMKPIYIVVSKMAPYFFISWGILQLIILLSVYLLDVPIAGSVIALNLFSLIFILVNLSLGLLISTLVNTQVAAMLASGMGLMLPAMILSGFVFPIESMPALLQGLSCIIPARWYVAGVRRLMIQGVPYYYLWKEALVLLTMVVVILTVSLKKFKIRL